MVRTRAICLIVLSLIATVVAGCGGGGAGVTAGGVGAEFGAVEVSPASVILAANAQELFTAELAGSAGTSVDWSVQEPTGGSVDQTSDTTAVYTAPSVGGTYHIVATSRTDTTKTATVEIRVNTLPPPPPME